MVHHRFFPNLHALRAYAAFSVIIAHLAHSFDWLRTDATNSPLEGLTLSGNDAVTLFFTLSGFLITYLLLIERNRSGSIHLRHFYWRRTLRIFPLYYLVWGVGVLLSPLASQGGISTQGAQVMAVIFAANFGYFFPIGMLSHLWTIGSEEQFYLGWAFLLKFQRVPLISIVLGYVTLRLLVEPLVPEPFREFYTIVRFECMLIGALGAIALIRYPVALKALFRRSVQVIVWVATAGVILLDPKPTVAGNIAIAGLFTILILNLAANTRTLISFESGLTHYLGEISYGTYMYHYPVLFLLISLSISGLPLWIGVIVLTYGLAAVSWQYFEKPLMRFKNWHPLASQHE